MSHDTCESLDDSTFEAVLGSSTWFIRTTLRNQELTYVLRIIQQLERAQALRSGNPSAGRRTLDPPPVVNLLIYERRNDRQFDITFSYDATFFLFATLQSGPSHRRSAISTLGSKHAVPSGCPVSSGVYLDHPTKAIYFIFPNLSVRNEGSYKLSFNLYETNSNPENRDAPAMKPDRESLEQDRSRDIASSCEGFIWRIEVHSAIFRVFNKKNFPDRSESTRLCRVLAEQGVRLRIRRVVKMGDREVKQEKEIKEETALGLSLVEQPDSDGSESEEDEFPP